MADRKPLVYLDNNLLGEMSAIDTLLVGREIKLVDCVLQRHPAATAPAMWTMSDITGYVPVVDGSDTLRWSDGATKFNLNLPVTTLGVGHSGEMGLFTTNALSGNRTYVLPNANGTILLDTSANPAHINGFAWRSTASSVIVGAGEAYVESVGRVVRSTGITLGGAIPANTWLHVYVDSSGTISAQLSAPNTPYFGTARSQTGAASRRYLFSIRSGAGGALPIMRGDGNGSVCDVSVLSNTGAAPGLLVSSGTSASAADVPADILAPANVTTDLYLRVYNIGAAAGFVRLYCWTGSSFVVQTNVPVPAEISSLMIPCDATPKVQYDVGGGGSASLSLLGYRYSR